jgi:hypothetical protein
MAAVRPLRVDDCLEPVALRIAPVEGQPGPAEQGQVAQLQCTSASGSKVVTPLLPKKGSIPVKTRYCPALSNTVMPESSPISPATS